MEDKVDKTLSILDTIIARLKEMLNVIPNLIGALVVFIVGWILAKTVSRILKTILEKTGIDKLAEKLNEIEIIYKSKIKIVPSIFLSKVLYYMILFVFAMAATEVLGMEAISELMQNTMAYIPKLFSALLVLVFGIFIADAIKNMVHTAANSLAIPSAKMISTIVFYFIFVNVLMITLKQAELKTDFIETNISIIFAGIIFAFALGYGMASKSLMSNILSSFYNKSKFELGTTIKVDGVKGKIISIDATSITLETENSNIVIPMGKLVDQKIEFFN